MTAQAVQHELKCAFEKWGRPERMRFDNGKPWRNPHLRVPTSLALWLYGLGIEVLFGRPRQCTDNAVVERHHGVLNGWVEPGECADQQDLARRLQRFAAIQREEYPACQGRTRRETFPELGQCPRPYGRDQDQDLWQITPVLQYVAGFVFRRKVEKNGRITVMTHEYSLNRSYRRQTVTVQLDPRTAHWVVKDRDGEVLKTFPAAQLTYETIAGMKLTYKDFKTQPAVASKGSQPYVV